MITGGTTGLGFETARQYLSEGAKVLITGRTQEKVDQAVNELGTGANGTAADSSKLEDLKKLASFAQESLGQVDILFVNAGGGIFGAISDIAEEDYDKQFDVNVKGVFFTVQQILPLIPKGGSIILNASAVNEKGVSTGTLYFATKAAVRSFARSMAAELGEKEIRVNSLSPGIVPTKFFNNSNVPDETYSDFEKMIVNSAPLKRAGKPADIAQAAIYLGSDESSYVTAVDLVVDGGWMNV